MPDCGGRAKMARGASWVSGLLAAAAHYALDHHVVRLGIDHQNAARLAKGLAQVLSGVAGASVQASPTNIVFVQLTSATTTALLVHLKQQGILATGLIGLRFVTHLDVSTADIDETIAAVAQFFAQ